MVKMPRLLDRSTTDDARTLYVYRSDEKKRPVGTHILRTTDPVSEDTIRSRFGPGWYYVIETGGGEPLNSAPLYCRPTEADAQAQVASTTALVATPVPDGGDNFYRDFNKYLQARLLLQESKPDGGDGLALARLVAEILTSRRGGQGEVDALLTGMELAHGDENTPADPLAAIVSRVAGTQKAPETGADLRRYIAGLAKQQRAILAHVQTLSKAIAEFRESATPPTIQTPPAVSDATILSALTTFASTGSRDLRTPLMELASNNTTVRTLLTTADPGILEQYIRRACLSAGRPDLQVDWIRDLHAILDELASEIAQTEPLADAPGDGIELEDDGLPSP